MYPHDDHKSPGLLFYLLIGLVLCPLVVLLDLLIRGHITPDRSQLPLLWQIVGGLAVLAAVLYLALLVKNFFPHITLTPAGLRLHGPYGITHLDWSEIERVETLPWPEASALTIRRPGASMRHPRGLAVYWLLGLLLRRRQPLVLISERNPQHFLILQTIQSHITSSDR